MMRGYERVTPTQAERDEYRRAHESIWYIARPTVYRVRCQACGKRLWGSGLGIGSHNRACPGAPR